MNTKIKTRAFDIAEYLETDEDIKAFLNEVAATGDSSDLIHAMGIVVRAKGVTCIAKDAGLTRTSLYKSLREKGND